MLPLRARSALLFVLLFGLGVMFVISVWTSDIYPVIGKQPLSQNSQSQIARAKYHAHEENLITRVERKVPEVKAREVNVYVDPGLYVHTTNEIVRNHSILIWNPPGWMANWYGDVDMRQCGHKNCQMEFHRGKFHQASAVMFSVGDSGMGYSPPVSPDKRNPDQAWLFYTLESPVHLMLSDFRSSQWHRTFNWSWNYRLDSDIFHTYGIMQTRQAPPVKNYTAIFKRKTKMAAWAVSHCGTHSKREDYVKILKTHTQVDIYGQCGQPYPSNFKQLLNNDYKFYLGFENSLCRDYVTEKLFNYLKSDVIVIVRGSFDYNKYLPKGTFINANDFSSIKALAEFMKNLAEDEDQYIKYLQNKDMYDIKERDFMFREALCNICHKVNNLEKYRKTYDNVEQWLGPCQQVTDLR